MFVLTTLGTLALHDATTGTRIGAARRKPLAVLALLAEAGEAGLSRERVAALLWPDQDPERARRSMAQAVYSVRRELGGRDPLCSDEAAGGTLRLDRAVVDSDLVRFCEAHERDDHVAAADAYGGPFLDAVFFRDCVDFERWAESVRERLESTHRATLLALADAADGRGNRAAGVRTAREGLARYPADSALAVALVRRLAEQGDVAGALDAARAHEALLRADYDATPGDALTRLVAELRTGRAPYVASRATAEPTVSPTAASPPPSASQVPAALGERPPQPDARRGWARPPWRWALGVALLAGLGGMFRVAMRGDVARTVAGATPRLDPRRVAVLYFDDHSPAHDLGYVASGITEELIHELAGVPALEVIARNGVKPYRDRAAPLDSIAAVLRVGTLVEGSVQRSGDRLRVTVQLIAADSGTHIASRTITRPFGELFALQDDVAREVAAVLRQQLGTEIRLQRVRAESRSARAQELVLRAEEMRSDAERIATRVDTIDARSARSLLRRADSLLAEAESADPAWVEPVVRRGWVAAGVARLSDEVARVGALGTALAHAERAARLAPRDARVLELRGVARYRWAVAQPDSARRLRDLPAAERDLRRAVEVDPRLASAWGWLSRYLIYAGAYGEAELAAERAFAADAYLEDAADIQNRLYQSELIVGDLTRAKRWCAQGHRDWPDDWRFVECELTIMREEQTKRPDPERAWSIIRRLAVIDPLTGAAARGHPYSPIFRQLIGAAISARAGDVDSARSVLEHMRRLVGGDPALRNDMRYDEAYVLLVLGDRAGAVRTLAEYVAARPDLRTYLARDPLFRGLRDSAGSVAR